MYEGNKSKEDLGAFKFEEKKTISLSEQGK